jgi:uncharacterized protein
VVQIESEPGLDGLHRGAERTLDAMRCGVEIVYRAIAVRRRAPRLFGLIGARGDPVAPLVGWSYEVADTKLARRVNPYFLLPQAFYSELLAGVQRTSRT